MIVRKIFLYCSFLIVSNLALSDVTQNQPINTNAAYISDQSYIQNPFIGLPSLGGTQTVTENQKTNHNVAEKWFADGAWNVQSSAAYLNLTGANNYAYGANIFGQTGSVVGFSFGGLMTILNPFFATEINPSNPAQQYQVLPVAQQVTPHELFVEYRYDNIVQADVGYIAIPNSPWLSTNYYMNYLVGFTYQGALVNVHPGGGWLLTALAFNGVQLIGENGFSGLTMYNQGFDYGTGTANIADDLSPRTMAIGASFVTFDNNYNLRLWAYNFGDYANLVYADNSIKLVANQNLNFTIAAQAGLERDAGNAILLAHDYGNVSSNFVGVQTGLTYKWFSITLGYNSIWGLQQNNIYDGGNIVSPYTYQLGTDPLYTTSWAVGMVEKSGGNAYKIAPTFTFLDGNLSFSPSYAYYSTNVVAPSTEYDFIVNYNIAQVKGLNLYGGLGLITQQANSDGTSGNVSIAEIRVNYLY